MTLSLPLPNSIWGFPQIRGTFLGVPIIGIIIYWGLYWGHPILGNYHIAMSWSSVCSVIGHNLQQSSFPHRALVVVRSLSLEIVGTLTASKDCRSHYFKSIPHPEDNYFCNVRSLETLSYCVFEGEHIAPTIHMNSVLSLVYGTELTTYSEGASYEEFS